MQKARGSYALIRGLRKPKKLRSGYQTQVTCAREAAYSSDNRGENAYIDIRSRLRKKQLKPHQTALLTIHQ